MPTAKYTANPYKPRPLKDWIRLVGALEELGVTWNLSRRGIPRVNPTTGAPVLDVNGRQIFDAQETYTSSGVTRPLIGAFPTENEAP